MPKAALFALTDAAAAERAAARPEVASLRKSADDKGVDFFEAFRVSRSDEHSVTVHFQVPQSLLSNRASRPVQQS
jgi:hypothetical protein